MKKQYEKPVLSRQQLEEELVETNARLLQANERLEQMEQTRMELFSNLSHDLRSPLTALVSSVGLLKSDPEMPTEHREELLDLMERRLRSMQTLINDMQLLTRVENPQIPLKLQPVDMGAFLEEFFCECETDGKYGERKLELVLPSAGKAVVAIDPEQMARVLDNLFTNALKYSSRGTKITLEGACEESAYLIRVRDEGIGIGSEDLPRIFERSYRVSKSRSPEDGSSGLGLAIAKGIVEKHGGEIGCESSLGQGTVFEIRLPIR